jgi:hypothetical protein
MGQYRLIDADGHLDERPEEMIHYLDEPREGIGFSGPRP